MKFYKVPQPQTSKDPHHVWLSFTWHLGCSRHCSEPPPQFKGSLQSTGTRGSDNTNTRRTFLCWRSTSTCLPAGGRWQREERCSAQPGSFGYLKDTSFTRLRAHRSDLPRSLKSAAGTHCSAVVHPATAPFEGPCCLSCQRWQPG